MSEQSIQNPIDPQLVQKMIYYIELIKSGSMSKASENLSVSTSTGSRWLSDLEQELNVQLYNRNDKNNRMTEAGSHLYESFDEVYSSIQILKSELSNFSTEHKGNVRICCTPVYADKVIVPIVSEYLDESPLINIKLTISPRGLEKHKDNDFIISAISGSAISKEDDLNLVRRNLLSERFILVASPKFIARYGEPLRPDELTNFRCLYSKSLSNGNIWNFHKSNEDFKVKLKKSIELSDANMIKNASVNSTGISYLPEFLVKRSIRDGELVPLLTEYETDQWYLNLYYPPQRFMSASVSSFKDAILNKHREKMKVFD